ncbi:MAG: hypothetical protein JSV64_02305 [Candidatus Bathyarchaeota archaeon]|nr:MAG: hypothetical protein JSV64_02305 [Candidatus Bathyarchaeota archaeon]
MKAEKKVLIVTSMIDVASMNIRNHLLANYGFIQTTEEFQSNPIYCNRLRGNEVKLVTIKDEPIYYQEITEHFSPHLIIYLSRHSSKSGTPTLSVHTPGNLGDAEKGGLPRKVSIAPAQAMRLSLQELLHQKARFGLTYEISYECTHHGPSLDVPAMFVELGSSAKQWEDMKAAKAVARAAMAPILKGVERSVVVLGIGGPHYSSKFTRLATEASYAFGHMIPKYAVSQINAGIIQQCINRTLEKVEGIILDWKGIKAADKPVLASALSKSKVNVQKV